MKLPAILSDPARGDLRPLSAQRAGGHLVATKRETWGLWRLGEAAWQYRDVAEQEALLSRTTSALASLVGRKVKLRVTTRPADGEAWGRRRQASVSHPLDEQRWNELVERSAARLSTQEPIGVPVTLDDEGGTAYDAVSPRGLVETQAYLSVLLGKADFAKVADDDAEVGGLLAGRGLHARRAEIGEQGWLMQRSVAPGHDPDGGEVDWWEVQDFADLSERVRWLCPPFGKAVEVRVARPEGIERRWVVVLSVGRMEDRQFPEDGSFPWLAFASRAGFPVEVVATGEIVSGRALASKFDGKRRIAEDIVHHHEQMDESPPESAFRARDRAAEVHDELTNGSPASNARFHGVVRFVVVGDSEEQAVDRARRLQQAYRAEQRIELVRPWDQVAALRELIPGEACVSDSFQRRLPLRYFAAGVPNVTGKVGNDAGFYLGFTTGDVPGRPVLHDPFHPMEKLNKSGLRSIVADPGAGKSALLCRIGYEAALSGAATFIFDPPGETAQICPLVPGAVHLNLTAARPGTFDPRRLIPMPDRADFDDDDVYQAERARVPELRHELLVDSLKGLTSASAQRGDGLEEALGEAVGEADGDPWGTLEVLRELDVRWHPVADALRRAAQGSARIIFPDQARPLDEDGLEDVPLIVMSMNGMSLPRQGDDASTWGHPERAAVMTVRLAIHYLRRFIYMRPRHERKVAEFDEAYWLGDMAGGAGVSRTLSRDSRRRNAAGYFFTHHAGDIRRLDPSSEVFSTGGWAGRQEKPSVAKATLELYNIPTGVGYEEQLADLRTGEFLHCDDMGRVDQMYVDFAHLPELFAAARTTPDGMR